MNFYDIDEQIRRIDCALQVLPGSISIEQAMRELRTIINIIDKNGFNVLHYACMNDLSSLVRILVVDFPHLLFKTSNMKIAPLHYALRQNRCSHAIVRSIDAETVSILHQTDNEGRIPLMVACEMGDSMLFMRLMDKHIEFNARLGTRDNNGENILHYIARSETFATRDSVTKCLQMGANCEDQDFVYGNTALFVAQAHDNIVVSNYLMNNTTAKDVKSFSGIDYSSI